MYNSLSNPFPQEEKKRGKGKINTQPSDGAGFAAVMWWGTQNSARVHMRVEKR